MLIIGGSDLTVGSLGAAGLIAMGIVTMIVYLWPRYEKSHQSSKQNT
jgi:hypothetical protein